MTKPCCVRKFRPMRNFDTMRTIKNPAFVIYRRDKPTCIYGADTFDCSYLEALEWISMDIDAIPMHNVKKWCSRNNPILCVFDVAKNEENVYSYCGGKKGVQLTLFNIKKILKDYEDQD